MPKITVTKETIKNVMLKEPLLLPGQWALEREGQCHVCAVGAIVKEALNTKDEGVISRISTRACSVRDLAREAAIEGHLEESEYLAALSCFFESNYSEEEVDLVYDGHFVPAKPKLRQKLADFVEDNFPDTITLEVD